MKIRPWISIARSGSVNKTAPRDVVVFRLNFHNRTTLENLIPRDGCLNRTDFIISKLSEATFLRVPLPKFIHRSDVLS